MTLWNRLLALLTRFPNTCWSIEPVKSIGAILERPPAGSHIGILPSLRSAWTEHGSS